MRFGPLIRWSTLVILLIAGVASSWQLSQAFRQDSFDAWTAQADNSGQFLSGTLLNWLEESYGPLLGLAALAENSSRLSESEFLGAYDSLEARASTFFLDGAAYLRRTDDDLWKVVYTTNPYSVLAEGTMLDRYPRINNTVLETETRFGDLIIGPPNKIGDQVFSAVGLMIETPEGEAIVLGIVDITALINGLYQIHVLPGMELTLEGKFLDGERELVWGAPATDALHEVTDRTVSAGADLSMTWAINLAFAGGPPQELARLTLLGGIGGTIGLALFIALLLWRNQNISDKVREATSELTQSMERFKALFEQSSDAHLIFSEDGILDCNDAAVRLVGCDSKDDLLSRHPAFFSPELQPDGQRSEDKAEEMDAIALRVGHHRFDWLARKKNGDTFPNEVSLTPVSIGGKSAMLVIWHDLTDRMRTEAELRSAMERADSANEAKSAFLANMSHELRTPMNAILGYSEMLMEEAEDLEQEEFIPDLKKINQAGTHLLALINDVLDLSKIESGKMELFPEEIDVKTLIEEVSATARPLVEKNGNQLIIKTEDLPETAFQDLTKIRQTLFNLLSNAAKFTEAGSVTLNVYRVTKQCDDWLNFTVTDTGIGIPEEKLEHIFKEFTQADDSTTRDYGGTGLGLAISQRFCNMLGGELTVSSKAGEGSSFSMLIPATAPGSKAKRSLQADEVAGPEVNEAPMTDGNSVLVIDDDPEASEIISRFLIKDGFNVVTASSGEQGLEIARKLQPAAITLDVMMPDMDGWSVLRALKSDQKLSAIPVIMLTMIDDRTRGYSLGAVDYLTKPVDREELNKALSAYRRGSGDATVLVVEDEADARELISRSLEKSGWQVTEAANGQEALHMLNNRTPDLVLLDLMMPVMDGFDFLTAMRAREEWQQIPVIVVTAKTITKEDRERLNGSVEEILRKNAYTREQLLDRVRETVAESSRRKPDLPEGL